MKTSLIRNLILLLALCVGCSYATDIRKSGTAFQHNFIYTHNWDFGASGLAMASGDVYFLYDDSAASTPYTLAGLRIKGLTETTPASIPDSIVVSIVVAGDGVDDVTFLVELDYSLRSGVWVQMGADESITLAMAAGTAKGISQLSRKPIPGAKYRLRVSVSSATDAATLFNVRVHAQGD